MNRIVFGISILFFAIVSMLSHRPPQFCGVETSNHVTMLRVGKVRLHVEVASSPAGRARGLMYRRELPQNCGMLFIFPESRQRSFWMKNTLIPLDLAYLSEEGIILKILAMFPEQTDEPLKHYPSFYPARYALEVNRDWFERNNITVGDRILLPTH